MPLGLDITDPSGAYQSYHAGAIGSGRNTVIEYFEKNWKKIGNMLVMEAKLNLAVGKRRFQGYGKKRAGVDTWDPYDVDIANTAPTLASKLEAKIMKSSMSSSWL